MDRQARDSEKTMRHHSVIVMRQIASLIRTSRILAKLRGLPDETKINRAASMFERAPRFPLPVKLWYRPDAASRWIQSTTRDISRSGVLFQAHTSLKRNTTIEIMLTMPAKATGKAAANLLCQARVVRTSASWVAARIVKHCVLGG